MYKMINTQGIHFYMERMQPNLRKQIAANGAIRSERAGESIAEWLVSPGEFAELLRRMSTLERFTLELIIKRMGLNIFDFSRLEAVRQNADGQLSGAQLKVGLSRLCSRGVIVCLEQKWGEPVYVLPDDLFRRTASCLMIPFNQQPIVDQEHILITRHAGRGLANDLFHFLVYIARNEVKFTRKGMIVKRHVDKLAGMVHLRDEWFTGMIEDADYPAGFFIVYEMALKLQLAERKENRLVLNEQRLKDWLNLSITDMNRQLYAIWCRSKMSADLLLQHLIIVLESLPVEMWYPLQKIYLYLQNNGIMIERDAMRQELTAGWFNMMSSFGWLETGEAHGTEVIRLMSELANFAAREDVDVTFNKYIVQPNFEVIVPPTVSFLIRWELELLADHLLTDRFSTYVLTPESVARAVLLGKLADDCIHFLINHSLYDIPNHVILSVRQWAVQAVETMQVRLTTTDDSDHRVSEPANSVRPLPTGSAGEWTYTLSSKWITIDEIYPNWNEIPVMWLQQIRSYHISTRKRIVEKAIEWQAMVKLRKHDAEIAICPIHITDDSRSFQLLARHGKEEITLSNDDWNEIQLLLPGINDE